ncbi:hypothetical protein ABFY60_15655 [Lysinibacillus pakistanensis]|uniref:hypothetical protein n=1 Tax=Lysinibacillus pakistanensis TaxID=759811 RepID=UPI003D2B2FBA
MDYKSFYAEVAEWIMQVNQVAVQHGMDSIEFWNWVSRSMGEIANKYKNNKLVQKQMVMLFSWLEDVYAEMKNRK